MATPLNRVSPTNKSSPVPDGSSSPRPKSGEQGFGRSAKGRVRTGGGGKAASSDSRPTPALPSKSDRFPPPTKPTLSVTPPSHPTATKSKHKNPPRHPPKANPSAHPSQSSPVAETPVTPSSRPSNRRRRSGAGRGNLPKIVPPTPTDDLLRPGRSRTTAPPHSAPLKDTPPHLSQKSSRASFDMSKDIAVLVERVRAVAMAENRPSTPGSHIDWAGDDDDSLPDLNDWGIPSLSEHKVQTISPIIVGGLKPLPEPNALSGDSIDQAVGERTEPQSAPLQPTGNNSPPAPAPTNDTSPKRTQLHPSLPPKPRISPMGRANEFRKPPRRTQVSEEPKASSLPVISQSTPDAPIPSGLNPPKISIEGLQTDEAERRMDEVGSGGLAASIHAPSTEGHAEPKKEGLMASIHAPRADSIPSSVQLDGHPLRNRETHMRSQTVGRPFPRPNDNLFARSPRIDRGGPHGSPRHARNHSSPSASTGNHRVSHSRPVLTGDAISRLVKTIGGATTPPTKLTPLAND